jgi:hypothetical protein
MEKNTAYIEMMLLVVTIHIQYDFAYKNISKQ